MARKRIIIVTDGDETAKRTVEKAAQNLGLRTISSSAGNPTPLSEGELATLILSAPQDPVLVMVDDAGTRRKGPGERILEDLVKDDRFEVLGVVVVASDTEKVEGIPVNVSVTANNQVIHEPVDKNGNPEPQGHFKVEGDTVDVLNRLSMPIVVGIGDPGKMSDADAFEKGAQVTTRAVQEILKFHGLAQG